MLHSALPRAYLGYAATNYFEEADHPYLYVPQHPAYALQRPVFSWGSQTTVPGEERPTTPCPLDLSLKPVSRSSEEIEVDDEEDRKSREEARYKRYNSEEEEVIVDDERSCSSTLSYPLTPKQVSSWYHPEQTYVQHHQQLLFTPPHAPMTPPSTPSPPQQCPPKKLKESHPSAPSTPSTPGKADKPARTKKKHVRKLKFDEENSSPVSGTVILGPDEAVVTGDIDPAFNIVEVTEEARAELAKIENRLGPYQCKLCHQLHEDAFQLAQHRCSRIAHVEYRCPECDKRFSCPANLASHRRWHKPRPAANSEEFLCTKCEAKFSKQAALRKHVASQHPGIEQNNNNNNDNNNDNNNQMDQRKVEQLVAGSMTMELA